MIEKGKMQEKTSQKLMQLEFNESSFTGQNKEEEDQEEGNTKEATSNAAAGQLTGTKERAHQKQ
jgi:hypothetical protein